MQYDILSIEENNTTLKVEASRAHSIKKMSVQRHGIRRFENGKMYQASRLGQTTKDRLITDSKEWGGQGVDCDLPFAKPHTEHRTYESCKETLFESYQSALDYLNTEFPDFVFSGQCSLKNKTISMTSSYGLELSTSGGVCDWYFSYQKKGSGNMWDGYLSDSCHSPDIFNLIKKQSDYIRATGKIYSLKSGKIPILYVEVLEPLSKLNQSFQINTYHDGAALYSGKLGQNLFDKKVTILDKNYDPSIGQISFFDGEGTVRFNDLELISEGEFASTISDIRFGKKYNSFSTGNGLRTYKSGVNLNFNSLRIKKSTSANSSTWKEILKNYDECLIATIAIGGESNDLGEFSSPVQVGYIMKRGEIVGQAPQVTIKTSVDRYLGTDLIDVSSDGFMENSSSACIISNMDVFLN